MQNLLFTNDTINHTDFQTWMNTLPTTQASVSGGRGKIQIAHWEQTPVVIRHYHRGGMIAKLVSDRYFYLGATRTRAYQEWQLLQTLEALNLPAPRPVAARIQIHGFTYRADLVMTLIPNAIPLADRLQQRPLDNTEWTALATLLHLFQHNGIYHADLNAYNILQDHNQQFWLIDFDKGKQGIYSESIHDSSIARLKRSLTKLLHHRQPCYFDESAWSFFLSELKRVRNCNK